MNNTTTLTGRGNEMRVEDLLANNGLAIEGEYDAISDGWHFAIYQHVGCIADRCCNVSLALCRWFHAFE